MLPTIKEAKIELEIAEKLNPGPWIEHSLNVGVAARNIAKKVPGMDENKAYIVGMLHDIGRRVGIVNTPQHVYEGYKYAIEKGWDEVRLYTGNRGRNSNKRIYYELSGR